MSWDRATEERVGGSAGFFDQVFGSLFGGQWNCCNEDREERRLHESVAFRARPVMAEEEEELSSGTTGMQWPADVTLRRLQADPKPPTAGEGGPHSNCLPVDSRTSSRSTSASSRSENVAAAMAFTMTTSVQSQCQSPRVEGEPAVEQFLEDFQCWYVGAMREGKMHGKGSARWIDGTTYKGEFHHGVPHGKGKLREPSGATYQGQWKDGKKHGWGEYTHVDGTVYQGQWVAGLQSGIGTEMWPDGAKYEGEYLSALKHGRGIFTHGRSEYIGEFDKDKMHGHGTYTFEDGRKYCGHWSHGRMCGTGRMEMVDGTSYEGTFQDDRYHGEGRLFAADGSVLFSGAWAEGKKHGKGRRTMDGVKVKEEWAHGELVATYTCTGMGSTLSVDSMEPLESAKN